jgi:hypothetical protein
MKHLKRIFEKVEDDKVEIMNLLSEIVDEFDGLEMEDVSYNYVDEDDIAIQISGFNNLLGEFEYLNFEGTLTIEHEDPSLPVPNLDDLGISNKLIFTVD